MLLVPRFAISNHVKEKKNLKAYKQEVHQTYFAHFKVGNFSFSEDSSKPSSNDAQILPLPSIITGRGDTRHSNGVSSHFSLKSFYIHAHKPSERHISSMLLWTCLHEFTCCTTQKDTIASSQKYIIRPIDLREPKKDMYCLMIQIHVGPNVGQTCWIFLQGLWYKILGIYNFFCPWMFGKAA